MDAIRIDQLSAANDLQMGMNSLGGMYDPADYRTEQGQPRKMLIPGVTDLWGEPLKGCDNA